MLNSVRFEPYYVYPKLHSCWIKYASSLTMCIRNCTHVEFSTLRALVCVSETALMLNSIRWALVCVSETALMLNSVRFQPYYMYPKLHSCWIQYARALVCVSETALMLNSVRFQPYYMYPKLHSCWIQYASSLTTCIRNCTHVEFSTLPALLHVSETALMLNSVRFEP